MKVLVFVLAYNAEKTVKSVLGRIPVALTRHQTTVLLIDYSSADMTTEKSIEFKEENDGYPFELIILRNPINQGYGGNVKLGMHYALNNGFDVICLIHADGQYAPEKLPELIQPIVDGKADVVFGSRMMEGFNALKGGMPLYKFLGNKILTWIENKLLRCDLSEFHTGLRLYSTATLRKIPFNLNSNDFDFDTEIIIQVLNVNGRIRELPIPTFYGDEISHVNGIRYAWDISVQALLAFCQRWGVTYRRRYDVGSREVERLYIVPKLSYSAVHQLAVDDIPENSRVLDVGSAVALVGKALKEKGCTVTGMDKSPPPEEGHLDHFMEYNLNCPDLPISFENYDVVLLLDVIGHLNEPERFMERLHLASTSRMETFVLVSAGNIGFLVNRLQLLFGYFNYGKRGILDPSHTRLFTFDSLSRLLTESGFTIEKVMALPAPFTVAFGDNWLARLLSALNKFLIHFSRGIFGYRIYIKARPRPTLEFLISEALLSEKKSAP